MPKSKKMTERSSSPDPLELLPPPRFSPLRRNQASPHKQLQLRLLELNADIADERTIESVLQELTPGKRNSFAFVDGKVNGRELFVTTRKPPAKRRPRKKKDDNGENASPKRGRPRKRPEPATPKSTQTSQGGQSATVETNELIMDDVELEGIEVPDVVADPDEEEVEEVSQAYSGFGDDEDGFGETTYDIQWPIEQEPEVREETPLPVTPYRSFHSSPPTSPSSPVYEEYQVPIPTSSSPTKPSTPVHTSRIVTPKYSGYSEDIDSSTIQNARRRTSSRSRSRERRMSFAPSQSWQGLPSTPSRVVKDIPDSEEEIEDQESLGTKSTEVPSLDGADQREFEEQVSTGPKNYESMTPVRNWAAEIAEGAFRSEKSPSKIIQFPTYPAQVDNEQDEDQHDSEADSENEFEEDDEDEGGFTNNNISLSEAHQRDLPKAHPQISRLQSPRRESPIVITSSPPDIPVQRHYQWKTIIPPNPERLQPIDDEISISNLTLSSPHRSPSRQSSPARSILAELGDDVVDISSMSPLAAKRAAKVLLRSPYYAKINLRDGPERQVWEEISAREDGLELLQDEISCDADDEITDESNLLSDNVVFGGEEEADEGVEIDSPCPVKQPRISHGQWSKVDWKRLEKCLDLTDGDQTDAIDLFMERYAGRERDEVELRCKAVTLTRRRRALEGRKVEFLLSTAE